MQDDMIIDGCYSRGTSAAALSKGRCTSAESSTCSCGGSAGAYHLINTPKPINCNASIKQRLGTSPDVISAGDGHGIEGASHRAYACCARHHDPEVFVKVSDDAHAVDHDCSSGDEIIMTKVCCMCGDVGIEELLLICSRCSHRHQHIYCSRSYPNMPREVFLCNWCLHEEDSMNATEAKESGHAVTNKALQHMPAATSTCRGRVDCNRPGLASHTHCELGLDEQVLITDEVILKKGHNNKAFEYLLLVASQSLLQNNVGADAGANVAEIKRDYDITSSTIIKSNRSCLPISRHTQMSEANAISMVSNIANMGPRFIHNQINLKNIEPKDKDVDVGSLMIRGMSGRPKQQQRCNKGIIISSKFKKKGLHLSPNSRPNHRRYKLLADVVC